MANRNLDAHILQAISETDKAVLQAIYTHRCLTENLIHRFFYEKSGIPQEVSASRIRWLKQKGLIEPMDYGGDFPALFLTTLGIETYRFLFDLPVEVFDPEVGKFKNALRIASDLKMKTNNLKHQMALNEFQLRFDERVAGRFAYTYQDEKFIRMSYAIRPDGLIQMSNVDLFIEIDMATEKHKVLLSKWDHYREFLRSSSYRCKGKKIIMLFALHNVKYIEQRRNVVLSSLQLGLLDTLDSCFEVYIDSPENLLDIVFRNFAPIKELYMKDLERISNMIQKKHGFIFSSSAFMEKIAEKNSYWAYIKKLDKEKHILIQDGRPQEFLFDSYCDRPLSILNQMLNHGNISITITKQFGRKIPYLIMVQDEKSIFQDLVVVNKFDLPNIYFTTEERMNTKTLPEALFQLDIDGNLFHFSDFSLTTRKFEANVKPKKNSKSII